MKTLLKFCLLSSLLLLCCARPYQGSTPFRNTGMQDIPTFHVPDPGKLESLAYTHFGQKDYVRALRYAYQAFRIDPADPRLLLLTGLIYEQGFNRPDLALQEYSRLFSLVGPKRLEKRMGSRMQYLLRKAQMRTANLALQPDQPPPLKGQKLAVFPFQIQGPTQPTLAQGIQDLLLHNVHHQLGYPDPFQLQMLTHVYLQAFPLSTPSEYAVWTGADLTLTGHLIDLGDHRIQITLQVLDATGQTVYTSPPVADNLGDLTQLNSDLLSQAAKGLEISLPIPVLSIASPIALMAYVQGRNAYLEDNLTQARQFLNDVLSMQPDADLIAQTLKWVENDLNNTDHPQLLVDLYWELETLPDPERALSRRLQSTHRLIVPSEGEITGQETHDPFKPPRPEAAP